jgi:hypothetical protein
MVNTWNVLIALESGTITVERVGAQTVLRYAASLRQLFLVVTGSVALVLAPTVLRSRNLETWEAVAMLAGAWIWLFGVNAILAAYRFPRWLRKAGRPSKISTVA